MRRTFSHIDDCLHIMSQISQRPNLRTRIDKLPCRTVSQAQIAHFYLVSSWRARIAEDKDIGWKRLMPLEPTISKKAMAKLDRANADDTELSAQNSRERALHNPLSKEDDEMSIIDETNDDQDPEQIQARDDAAAAAAAVEEEARYASEFAERLAVLMPGKDEAYLDMLKLLDQQPALMRRLRLDPANIDDNPIVQDIKANEPQNYEELQKHITNANMKYMTGRLGENSGGPLGLLPRTSPAQKTDDSVVSINDFRLSATSQTGRHQSDQGVDSLTYYNERLIRGMEAERLAHVKEAELRLARVAPDPDEGLVLFGAKLVHRGFTVSGERIFHVQSGDENPELPRNTFRVGMMLSISEYVKGSATVAPEMHCALAYLARVKPTYLEIHVLFHGNAREVPEICRIDKAFDDTVFRRMSIAVDSMVLDVSRQNMEQARLDARTDHSLVEQRTSLVLAGTALRDLIVPALNCDTPLKEDWKSQLLTKNGLLDSWIQRHNANVPVKVEGDPTILDHLNASQTKAIARALANRITLIQGPPGTGKSATIVGLVRLLKESFQISMPILVCAATHAAVDHLTKSLADVGLRPLRIGRRERIRLDCRDWSYDELEMRHPKHYKLAAARSDADTAQAALKRLGYTFKSPLIDAAIRVKDDELPDEDETQSIFQELLQPDISNKEEIEMWLGRFNRARGRAHGLYKSIRTDLYSKSDVVLSTTIGASSKDLDQCDFPLVILDEAAQCNHASSIIPIMRGCEQLVLVGDHKQLEAVCLSAEATKLGFTRSLFEDLMNQDGCPRIMLNEQYRMPSDIAAFPNQTFYNGRLRTAAYAASTRIQSSYLPEKSNIVFLDHPHNETFAAKSRQNVGEVQIIAEILADLFEHNPNLDGSQIGVIAPYSAQAYLLRELPPTIRSILPPCGRESQKIEIKTVDGFQGREKDVIILSTVRSNAGGNIGFLEDPRRLNVALTRARKALFIVGNQQTLSKEQHVWQDYMKWLETNKLILPYYATRQKTEVARQERRIAEDRSSMSNERTLLPNKSPESQTLSSQLAGRSQWILVD